MPYHGRLYVTEHHACFHSSVLLKDTKVSKPDPWLATRLFRWKRGLNLWMNGLAVLFVANGEMYSYTFAFFPNYVLSWAHSLLGLGDTPYTVHFRNTSCLKKIYIYFRVTPATRGLWGVWYRNLDTTQPYSFLICILLGTSTDLIIVWKAFLLVWCEGLLLLCVFL